MMLVCTYEYTTIKRYAFIKNFTPLYFNCGLILPFPTLTANSVQHFAISLETFTTIFTS